MTKDELFQMMKEDFCTDPDYPWAEDPYAVFRHEHNKKWFCLYMPIPADKIGISEDRMVEIINLKCDPMLIGSLLMKEGFHRAYHMNKTKWISVRLDGSVPTEEIKDLVDLSYRLTE